MNERLARMLEDHDKRHQALEDLDRAYEEMDQADYERDLDEEDR